MSIDILQSPYRPIRRVAPPDVPLPGVLVTTNDAESALLVDLELVPDECWLDRDVDHVWAPRDIVRTATGQSALFPWCTQTVTALLAQRTADVLVAGEAVTFAVSMVRGLLELTGAGQTGTWWISDEGRPMFVFGSGGVAHVATQQTMQQVAEACADSVVAKAISTTAAALDAHMTAERAAAIEARLFALAAAQPIRIASSEPNVDSELATLRLASPDSPRSETTIRSILMERARTALARFRPTENTTSTRRKPREDVKRPRPILVGLAIAAVIAIVGVMWPSDDESRAAPGAVSTGAPRDESTPASDPVTQDATKHDDEAATAAPKDGVPDGSDIAAIAAAVQEATRTCVAAGSSCAQSAESEAIARELAGLGALNLVEDYGGVAVFRAESESGDVYVVMERREGVWLCREINPVAG